MNPIAETNEHMHAFGFDDEPGTEVEVPITFELTGREYEYSFRGRITADGVELPDEEEQIETFRRYVQNITTDLQEE